MSKLKYWVGDAPACDRCGLPPKQAFSDARIPGASWAIVCDACRPSWGLRPTDYGTGIGQRYEKQEDGRWLKTKG